MRVPRKVRKLAGNGEAWFYIVPTGIEIYVSEYEGNAAIHAFIIHTEQLKRALQVAEENKG
jgi:hypothetical protein